MAQNPMMFRRQGFARQPMGARPPMAGNPSLARPPAQNIAPPQGFTPQPAPQQPPAQNAFLSAQPQGFTPPAQGDMTNQLTAQNYALNRLNQSPPSADIMADRMANEKLRQQAQAMPANRPSVLRPLG